MVERIEKTGGQEYWQVAATKETKEDKKRQEKGNPQEQKDSFEETSDFVQLLAKDPRKFSRETLPATQIKGFTYRGVSTHRDKSLLEVDISLMNGQLIKGAQVALTRQEGMRYISRRPGEEIVVDQIVQGTFLTVAVPQKGAGVHPPPASVAAPTASPGAKNRTRMGWFYYLGLSALLLAVILLIYLFI